MKLTKLNPLALLATACLLSSSAWAGDTKTDDKDCKDGSCHHGGRKEAMMKKFDTNADGKLDDTEKAAMKAAMDARHAEILAKYDKDGDGKLNDTERAAAKADWEKSQPKN